MRCYEGVYHTFVDAQRIPNVDWGIYYDGQNPNWLEAVCHELTHYLQDYVGCKLQGGNQLASLSQGKITPHPIIQKAYSEKDWIVESEAYYFQKKPEVLMKLFAHYNL
jgi:hypothetical protein